MPIKISNQRYEEIKRIVVMVFIKECVWALSKQTEKLQQFFRIIFSLQGGASNDKRKYF